MKVGVVLLEFEQKCDLMFYMIFDGDRVFGIQFFDLNYDYVKSGLYRVVEGELVRNLLRDLKVYDIGIVLINLCNNLDQFELLFKLSELFGFVFCVVDDGYKIIVLYFDVFDLSKGLWFELYCFKSIERYIINYIEIIVYEDFKLFNS